MTCRDSMYVLSPSTMHPMADHSLIIFVIAVAKVALEFYYLFQLLACILEWKRAFPFTHPHLHTTHTLRAHRYFLIQCALIHYIHYYFLCSSDPKLTGGSSLKLAFMCFWCVLTSFWVFPCFLVQGIPELSECPLN